MSEFKSRRAALAAELDERKLDALLVTALPNVRYLTGFSGSNAVTLLLREGALLFTDPRYALHAKQASGRVKVCRGPLLKDVVETVRRRRIRRLGFEKSRLGFEAYDFLRAGLPARTALEPVAALVERQRMIKSDEETALVRESVRLNSLAFRQSLRHVREGMRETDLAAEIEYRMRRLGAERAAFETIVAFGRHSALPHAQPGARVLGRADWVLIDMGAQYQGYASDMTRVLFHGRVSRRARQLYRAVLEAQLAAIAAVRPGVAAGRVDREARRVLKAAGLDRFFTHSTGHGLGLEIHEAPRLGRNEKLRLEAGMTLTVEPGIYLEELGGIRIEDTVLVTGRGCEVLTPTPKEILEI
ncbi:MAG: aminopeptidase P family protein [Bryobacterales bacterium]|nr:aminopeptidase P family protein [Bryobacterales bacterium]